MADQINKALDDLVQAARSLVRWLVLLIVSPTTYSVLSWFKRDKPKDGITPARKTFLERRKERRQKRKER